MNARKKHRNRVYRLDALSFLPLKRRLIEARQDAPPRNLNLQKDVDEELASKLTARMKAEYNKPLLFADWKVESHHAFGIRETAGSDA